MRNERERLSNSDEVDLFDVMHGLWTQKLLIIAVTAVITAAAAAYAFLATPIFEARIFVQPPTQNDVSALNYGRGGDSGLAMLTSADVYQVYLRNLQSESLRRKFFRDFYLPHLSDADRKGSQDVLYANLKQLLTVNVVSKEDPTRFDVTVALPDPGMAAQWAVKYADMASDGAKADVAKDVRADALVQANNLEQHIIRSKESTSKQREDEIARLNEALLVAKSIGLERPPIISNSLSAEVSAGMAGSLVYMRGSKALEAEIENLRHRKSDDPFVANLRQRLELLNFYRALKVDPAVFEVYRQDGALDVPDKPIKPKKALIVAFGAVLGFGFAALLALVINLAQERKRRKENY